MLAAATLFFDVGVQRDLWPGGAWPLVRADEAEMVARLCALALRLGVRRSGIVCLHGPDTTADVAAGAPPHCLAGTTGMVRVTGSDAPQPLRWWTAATALGDVRDLDRTHADYVASGCGAAPDDVPAFGRIVDHATAGVRDAVVFGAGLEHGVARAIDALLQRRVRTHVALDATGAASAEDAQRVLAGWKRRMVDVTTTAVVEHLLTRRGAN